MTKAMILAAGRGERMGELTQVCPKPLLLVRGQPLISYHLRKLATIGIKDCVINLRYLGEQIRQTLGDGAHFGINLHYSHEVEALETAGGIIQTLDFFEDQPFLLVNGDIMTDYPFEQLLTHRLDQTLAHLILMDNPSHHPGGDFALTSQDILSLEGAKLTYTGMGIYHPRLFAQYSPGHRTLGSVLKTAIVQQQVMGEYYQGRWLNVDTPERLAMAQDFFCQV